MAFNSPIRPWMLVAALWVWPAAFNVLNRVIQGRLQGWDPATPGELIFVAGDWLMYAAVTPFVFWTSNRWRVVRAVRIRRIAIHLGWALAFSVVWAAGGKVYQLVLMTALDPDALRTTVSAAGNELGRRVAIDVAGWILTTLPFGVIVYATVAGMAHAIAYFSEARDHQVEAARLAQQLTTARYSALQARLQPHFLFNTLNTIAVFVREGDRTRAVRMVEHLSELLRRTLGPHGTHEVTLGEELNLVHQYLTIEQERFEDRMRVDVISPPTLSGAAVPGFAVQHLVENAIRHGIAKRIDAGYLVLRVRREDDELIVTVEDDGPGLDPDAPLEAHGLANTRERLVGLYGEDRASLEVTSRPSGGTMAELRVPYREMEDRTP